MEDLSKMDKKTDKIEFETFRQIGSWEIGNLERKEPTSFNGSVNFKKYKVTIEEVIEPNEVYAKRIQKLWDECDNNHHWTPLKQAANSVGYILIGEAGKNRKRHV